ncbi:MAG: hypothetical protein RR847_03815 [Bacilli bacterium]
MKTNKEINEKNWSTIVIKNETIDGGVDQIRNGLHNDQPETLWLSEYNGNQTGNIKSLSNIPSYMNLDENGKINKKGYIIKLKENARILFVKTKKELSNLIEKSKKTEFQKIASSYDGIYYTDEIAATPLVIFNSQIIKAYRTFDIEAIEHNEDLLQEYQYYINETSISPWIDFDQSTKEKQLVKNK